MTDNLIKSLAVSLSIVLFMGLVVYGIISWEIYKYRDCKKVGHGTAYCLLAKGN